MTVYYKEKPEYTYYCYKHGKHGSLGYASALIERGPNAKDATHRHKFGDPSTMERIPPYNQGSDANET